MACVETVCHKQQNITSNTVLNMFLWLVLNHKNFEKVYLLSIFCSAASESKCAFKHVLRKNVQKYHEFLKSTALN